MRDIEPTMAMTSQWQRDFDAWMNSEGTAGWAALLGRAAGRIDDLSRLVTELAAAPAVLASCGHPCDEDGECGCASWPERAPDVAATVAAGYPRLAAVLAERAAER